MTLPFARLFYSMPLGDVCYSYNYAIKWVMKTSNKNILSKLRCLYCFTEGDSVNEFVFISFTRKQKMHCHAPVRAIMVPCICVLLLHAFLVSAFVVMDNLGLRRNFGKRAEILGARS